MSNSSAYTWEVPYRGSLHVLLTEGTTVWCALVTVLKQLLLNGEVEQLFQ
jgi:hypothetical protein